MAGPEATTWPPDDVSKHYGRIFKFFLGVQSFEPTTYGTTLKCLTVRPREQDVKGLPAKRYLNCETVDGRETKGASPRIPYDQVPEPWAKPLTARHEIRANRQHLM